MNLFIRTCAYVLLLFVGIFFHNKICFAQYTIEVPHYEQVADNIKYKISQPRVDSGFVKEKKLAKRETKNLNSYILGRVKFDDFAENAILYNDKPFIQFSRCHFEFDNLGRATNKNCQELGKGQYYSLDSLDKFRQFAVSFEQSKKLLQYSITFLGSLFLWTKSAAVITPALGIEFPTVMTSISSGVLRGLVAKNVVIEMTGSTGAYSLTAPATQPFFSETSSMNNLTQYDFTNADYWKETQDYYVDEIEGDDPWLNNTMSIIDRILSIHEPASFEYQSFKIGGERVTGEAPYWINADKYCNECMILGSEDS